MTFGGMADVNRRYGEACATHGRRKGRLMCSYFTRFADTPAALAAARERQNRYYKECAIAAFPRDPKTIPRAIVTFWRWLIGGGSCGRRTCRAIPC